MASWQRASLVGNWAALQSAQQTLSATLQTYKTTLAAISGLTNSSLLLPSAVSALGTVAQGAITLATNAMTDFLGQGFYVLIVYPQTLDWSGAKIRESLEGVESTISRYETAKRSGAPIDEAKLASLYEEQARLRRDLELAKTDLPLEFPYSSWVDLVARSFDDPADSRRPKFGSSAILAGAAVVIGANGVSEFATALKGLLNVFKAKALARRVDLAAAVLGLNRTPIENRTGIHQPPDWNSWTLARLFGLEKTIDTLRLTANSMTVSTSSTATKIINYISTVVAALDGANTAMKNTFDLLGALALANASAQVLYIPAVEGDRTLTVQGTSFSVPNCTYGNAGFIRMLRSATNAPTERYVAGVVILTGVAIPGLANLLGTLGVPGFSSDVSSIDMDAVLNASITSGQVTALLEQINSARSIVESNYRVMTRVLGA